jgi:hypothetical protein
METCSAVLQPALGHTRPPIQLTPSKGGGLSRGQSGPGLKLITHLHLAPTLGMGGPIPPLPHIPLQRAQE